MGSISGGILDFVCSFPYNGPLYVGNGGLQLSEVIFSLQNDLNNWGNRDNFLFFVVNYTILIE